MGRSRPEPVMPVGEMEVCEEAVGGGSDGHGTGP
jgi:hypothetical protein